MRGSSEGVPKPSVLLIVPRGRRWQEPGQLERDEAQRPRDTFTCNACMHCRVEIFPVVEWSFHHNRLPFHHELPPAIKPTYRWNFPISTTLRRLWASIKYCFIRSWQIASRQHPKWRKHNQHTGITETHC